jgi:endonuclease/exonuclease/phosphatase family metal-dependent hydrolase
VPLLVRTWNVFHGNAVPSERRAFLRDAIELVCADEPDLVCLQELPAWALERLDEWSGMRAFGAVAARPRLGPFPSTAEVGRRISSIHNGLLRSVFSGQANAILAAPALRPLGEQQTIVLNERSFRRAQARWLDLDLLTRLAWAKERRVCHAVRLVLPDDRAVLLANLHATASRDRRVSDAELFRAATFADALAAPDDVCVVAGDFNVTAETSRTLDDLIGPEWGFSAPGPAVDHILVRGAKPEAARTWPPERRRVQARLLSDHAPVELEIDV